MNKSDISKTVELAVPCANPHIETSKKKKKKTDRNGQKQLCQNTRNSKTFTATNEMLHQEEANGRCDHIKQKTRKEKKKPA